MSQRSSRFPYRRGVPVVRRGVGVNTTIDPLQQEDSGGWRARVRVERTYIRTYIKDRSKVDPDYAARL